MKVRNQIVCLLALLAAGAVSATLGQTTIERPRLDPGTFSKTTVTSSGSGVQTSTALGQLQTALSEPIIGISNSDNVVVNLRLKNALVATATANSVEDMARAFLRANLRYLAPTIALPDLRIKALPYSCEVAPVDSGRSGKTLIFEHVVEGTPVIGSFIAVRVEGKGTIATVYNSLAPVPRQIFPESLTSAAVPPLTISRPKFDRVVPSVQQQRDVTKAAAPVLVPIRDGSTAGLLRARHIVWPNAAGELMSGFLLPDETVIAGTMVPATRKDKSIPLAQIDPNTKLPTFVSFRPIGGLPISSVGVFNNPAEIAFRYLEENPEVFRIGTPRCQFDVLDIRRSSSNPRTSFVRLGQVQAGRTVFGAQLVFEIQDDNRLQTIQGHTIAHAVKLVPDISPQTARAKATATLEASLANASRAIRAEAQRRPITTELVIFPGELIAQRGLAKNPPTSLAYHTRSLLHALFVDAKNGDILYGYSLTQGANIIREASGKTILDKPLFREVSRNGVPTSPGTPLSADAAGAIPLVAGTAAFYLAHGWNGTDGNGTHMVANVNVNLFTCPNAFSPPLDEESYFCTGEAVPDIVAHELTHGVIWNSSNLVYADESGALNESYADVMGNLAFPDRILPGEVAPRWRVGESGVGGVRDMANPALSTPFPQPVNYAGYVSRTALGCSPADLPGLTCDFGGVHTNSGILNRAHVLMSDGGVGGLVGMGRGRLRMLAFDVMAMRLSPWSRLIDSAVATRASCDAILARGGADLTGAPFTQLHCDQIPGAFATVGLDPDLVTNYIPPTAAFAGIVARFLGEPTENACTVTDLRLQMATPSGLLSSQASLVPAGAPLTINYFGLLTATIGGTAPPIGTATKTHVISWTSTFGQTPLISSALTALPPPGRTNCRGGLITETKRSAITGSSGIPWVGGAGTLTTGLRVSAMDPACTLVRTKVEIVDDSGSPISDPAAATSWSRVDYIWTVPVTRTRSASVTRQPAGASPAGSFDLSAPVAWSYSAGLPDVKWRLVYVIDKPPGVTCTP